MKAIKVNQWQEGNQYAWITKGSKWFRRYAIQLDDGSLICESDHQNEGGEFSSKQGAILAIDLIQNHGITADFICHHCGGDTIDEMASQIKYLRGSDLEHDALADGVKELQEWQAKV